MTVASNNTDAEMSGIHFMFDLADGNITEACCLYQELFPGHRIPEKGVFSKVYQHLRQWSIYITLNWPREATFSEYSQFGEKGVAPCGTGTWD
jgi:hypothetical protein